MGGGGTGEEDSGQKIVNAHSTLDIKIVSISTGEGRGGAQKKFPLWRREGGHGYGTIQ